MVKAKQVSHQVGGHEGAFMEMEPGVIRKHVSRKEFHFYIELHEGGEHDLFAPYAPAFKGTSSTGTGDLFVHMEDLTAGMHWPSIMDVKIGTRSYAEQEPETKKAKMRKKDMESTTHTLGMRITGMRVHNVYEHTQNIHDKVWGRGITEPATQKALEEYFCDGSGNLRRKEAKIFAEKIKSVIDFMATQNDFRLFSSSLLFVYDACPCSIAEPRLRMIDFAHVHKARTPGPDEGYLVGANNLHRFISAIADDTQA